MPHHHLFLIMKVAILRNGLVENVIVSDGLDDPSIFPEGTTPMECPDGVGVGWRLDSGGWVAPPPGAPSPTVRVWTALEFDRRVEGISPGAWDRLEAAAANPELPAEARVQLRAAIRQSSKAAEIISDDQSTIAFLGAAVALGVITSEERDRILTDP